MSFSGPFDAIGSFADEKLAVFEAANQAGILGAASGAEVADVEQMKKTVPFIRHV